MTEIVKRRRRWPWVALVALVLLIGGPIAWRFRPLNTVERAFVGHWNDGSTNGFRFDANHCCAGDGADGEVITGTWSARGSTLSICFRTEFKDYANLPWGSALSRYLETLLSPPSGEVKWDGVNHFSWQGTEFVRVRE